MDKTKEKTITGVKAFNQNWKCKDFQFEVGKTYTHNGKVKICESGFHFCENPLDILNYYPLNSKFAEVEGSNDIETHADDSKIACKNLTIKAELNLKAFISLAVKFISSKAKISDGANSATTGNRANSATTGDEANSATTGNRANSATTGNRANSATTGDGANSATTGNRANSATTGNRANSATTGNRANSATTGNGANSATTGYGANSATTGDGANSATTGNRANSATTGDGANSATTGNRANSATTGNRANSATTGNNTISAGLGIQNKSKANKNSWIVCSEWFYDAEWKIKEVKAIQVDGINIKANTFYKLENGQFIEAEND